MQGDSVKFWVSTAKFRINSRSFKIKNEKMAFGVEDVWRQKIKTKGGLFVLNQCGHWRFRLEEVKKAPSEIMNLEKVDVWS